ncbi:MAG: glycosyltransferase family protein [Odoribacter sp.]
MKILAITQARYGSTRLPAKILKEVNGMTLLEIHLRRILRSKLISKLKVATTNEEGAKYITDIADKLGVEYYQGSVDDVLERFYKTAEPECPDYVVRLTSDCPLIDPEIIDRVVQKCIDTGCDYVSNTLALTFPDGIDTEVFRFSALKDAYEKAELKSEREHVTPFIWKNSSFKGGTMFTSDNYYNTEDLSLERITVDTAEDFELIRRLIEKLGIDCPYTDYIEFLNRDNNIRSINQHFTRNEGYEKSLKNDLKINK